MNSYFGNLAVARDRKTAFVDASWQFENIVLQFPISKNRMVMVIWFVCFLFGKYLVLETI